MYVRFWTLSHCHIIKQWLFSTIQCLCSLYVCTFMNPVILSHNQRVAIHYNPMSMFPLCMYCFEPCHIVTYSKSGYSLLCNIHVPYMYALFLTLSHCHIIKQWLFTIMQCPCPLYVCTFLNPVTLSHNQAVAVQYNPMSMFPLCMYFYEPCHIVT